LAAELGYHNLFVLHEGMPVWEEKGYAVYAGPDYEKRIETTRITPVELKKLMETKPGSLTLVDVRDPQESPKVTSRERSTSPQTYLLRVRLCWKRRN
jgi:hypothetical protein